jgi:hypothetical protein
MDELFSIQQIITFMLGAAVVSLYLIAKHTQKMTDDLKAIRALLNHQIERDRR